MCACLCVRIHAQTLAGPGRCVTLPRTARALASGQTQPFPRFQQVPRGEGWVLIASGSSLGAQFLFPFSLFLSPLTLPKRVASLLLNVFHCMRSDPSLISSTIHSYKVPRSNNDYLGGDRGGGAVMCLTWLQWGPKSQLLNSRVFRNLAVKHRYY